MPAAGPAALFGAALLVAAPCLAGPPRLSLPLDCSLGETCFIEDYVDARPGAGLADYTCGLKTREDHRGTDFALLSFDAMARGVDVLAAAPGTVDALRDGMADTPATAATRQALEGRECGNAVRIAHGDGWHTLYCHLEKGSLAVTEGQKVARGDRLGRVGLSGLTNAPHLHLGVLHDGRVVDPFRPGDTPCDSDPGDGLWQTAPAYLHAGLFTAGFSAGVPDLDDVQTGDARLRQTTPDSPLVLYGHVFHARPGDRLTLEATGPEGAVFSETLILADPQAQLFRAHGRKAPPGGWLPGAYRGYVTLTRGATVIARRHADIELRR